MMEAMETYVPCVIEDFAPGDRIYHVHNKDGVCFGRVIKAQGKTISVIMDTGETKKANLSSFQKEHGQLWGKSLDLDSLKIGDRISHWDKSQRRTFATILAIVPNESITVEMEITYPKEDDSYNYVHTYTNKNQTLGWWLAKWELEG